MPNHWSRTNIIFTIEKKNNIPNLENCEIWYNGCNLCSVINNQINECSEEICSEYSLPYCSLSNTGH